MWLRNYLLYYTLNMGLLSSYRLSNNAAIIVLRFFNILFVIFTKPIDNLVFHMWI